MAKNINFVFYGKLKSNGSLNFLLPKKRVGKKDFILSGYKIYKKRHSFVATKTVEGDKVDAEFWTFNLRFVSPRLFLFYLDLVEGVFLGKYKRTIEKTEYGEGWIYIGLKK